MGRQRDRADAHGDDRSNDDRSNDDRSNDDRSNDDRSPKSCVVCGRSIEWRAKWARNWASVKYCSDGCRTRRLSATDLQLEREIESLLDRRAAGATICPSEAARTIGGDDWRPLMEPARAAARRLVVAGRVEITQGGRVVDPSTAKGPIRVRRSPGR